MESRHKKKAVAGLSVWFAVIPAAILAMAVCDKSADAAGGHSLGTAKGIIIVAAMLIQYGAFFWGGTHLAKAKGYSNVLIALGIFWPAQLIVLSLLLFAMPDRFVRRPGQRPERGPRETESRSQRVGRYRRKALVANALGLGGVLVALGFVFLPPGLAKGLGHARAAGILIFVPSYAAVLYGCWWWVRAKRWPETMILVGSLPVIAVFIPCIRLLYRIAPLALPVGMVLMPVIMLAIAAALPDKSRVRKGKPLDRDE